MLKTGDIGLHGFNIEKESHEEKLEKRKKAVDFLKNNGESDVESVAKHIKDFQQNTRGLLYFLTRIGVAEKRIKKVKVRDSFSGKTHMAKMCFFSLVRQPLGDYELSPEIYSRVMRDGEFKTRCDVVLDFLKDNGEVTTKTILDGTKLRAGTLNTILKQLEEDGSVKKFKKREKTQDKTGRIMHRFINYYGVTDEL